MNYWITDEQGDPVTNCGREYMRYFDWHEKKPDSSGWYIKKTGVGFQLLRDTPVDGVEVSTVYLGMDHNWMGGSPVLWETMVFSAGWDGDFCERFSSQEEARRRHVEVCRLIASEGLEALTNRSLT